MLLSDVAVYFDKTPCTDVYSPFATFYGQLDVFDDSKRDGATVNRRVLSVAPGTSIPARRTVTVAAEQWLIGTHQADQFMGSSIRDKYVLHRALGTATIKTLVQLLTSGGVSTYAAKVWVKDMKELEASSELKSFMNIFLPSTDAAVEGDVITLAGTHYVVRNSYLSAAGFLVAEANELDAGALTTGTYTPRVYVPATDSRTSGTPVAVSTLVTRFQDNYEYPTQAAPKLEPGDIRAVITQAAVANPLPGDLLQIASVDWKVLTAGADGSCWNLHLRRA